MTKKTIFNLKYWKIVRGGFYYKGEYVYLTDKEKEKIRKQLKYD